MRGYFQEQYDRMIRSSKYLDNEDDLIHFVQNCYHLKDWIKNDPIIKKQFNGFSNKAIKKKSVASTMNDVEDFISINPWFNALRSLPQGDLQIIQNTFR